MKRVIAMTFGNDALPGRWPAKQARAYHKKFGKELSSHYPARDVCDAVAAAYPLLAELHADREKPDAWAGPTCSPSSPWLAPLERPPGIRKLRIATAMAAAPIVTVLAKEFPGCTARQLASTGYFET